MTKSHAGELEHLCQHPRKNYPRLLDQSSRIHCNLPVSLWSEFVFCGCLVIGVTVCVLPRATEIFLLIVAFAGSYHWSLR